jgi:hypothetical protein
MKAKFVSESLKESVKSLYNDEDENQDTEVIDEPQFNDVEEFADDENDLIIKDELETQLDNQLKIPEFVRKSFRVKGIAGEVSAIPMAKTKDGSFLMKIGDTYKKFKMNDIIGEE